jgi:hypothetical protein
MAMERMLFTKGLVNKKGTEEKLMEKYTRRTLSWDFRGVGL